ncbi:hypothetical protein Y88_2880 [Novosphingobium nitrogenifigens DSM 19370]|uniref:Uncharacterized protein n=1 Tax=Novosphingobium nitrogenifigens DSM 19370 TaxID=983920 RepID=F1Z4I0_9SPHN|nr:hypothetical protein Y88_2880 [Novosphingobium nitrogenifigens DSM 19370]
MCDVTFSISRAINPQGRRDIEMHIVCVVKGYAPCLTNHFTDRVILQRTLQLLKDRQGIHCPEAAAQLRNNVDVIFVIGAARGNSSVDRHRALRIEMLDLTIESGICLQILPHRLVAAYRLAVERRRKLSAQSDFGENPVDGIVERVAALAGNRGVHHFLHLSDQFDILVIPCIATPNKMGRLPASVKGGKVRLLRTLWKMTNAAYP